MIPPSQCSLYLRVRLCLVAIIATLTTSITHAENEAEAFGSSVYNPNALIGILYDLKLNQQRKAIGMNIERYNQLIDEFLASGWSEDILNRYFRASLPLYATQVFLPLRSANSAPVAFGVEDIVKPQFWVVHYKGQVAPPTSGRWRFWGWGEEVCSVAINGKHVLLANWHEITTPSVSWKSPRAPGQKASNGHLIAGDWIELEAGEVVDIDILIGERGGGVFASYLLIEKEGESYGEVGGHPILPVFQLTPYDTPQPRAPSHGPVIAPNGPIWTTIE